MEYYVKVKKELCTGCRLCELVCIHHKQGFVEPSRSRIQVYKNEFEGIEKPIVCRQCKKPECVAACPTSSLYKDGETGIIRYVEDTCSRYKACVEACPFDSIWYHAEDHIILKCDFCDGDPQCVKYCPTNALVIGERKSDKQKVVTEKNMEKGGSAS